MYSNAMSSTQSSESRRAKSFYKRRAVGSKRWVKYVHIKSFLCQVTFIKDVCI